ncbi:protein transport protein Sec24C-like isoform X2 [Zootermopsis nevadensis]|nr:protein transport protein Sec24C-like isoform X2 [Zootermopsis nevadensis]XP_021924351.1 protein transport protein Sec24C-like isoform X2 [Zootermopsis nevadensis]
MNPQPPEEQQQEPGGIHPPGAPGPRNMEPPPQNTLPPNNNIPVEPGMMPGGSMASAHQPDIYGSDFTNGLASLPLVILWPPETSAPSQLAESNLSEQSGQAAQISDMPHSNAGVPPQIQQPPMGPQDPPQMQQPPMGPQDPLQMQQSPMGPQDPPQMQQPPMGPQDPPQMQQPPMGPQDPPQMQQPPMGPQDPPQMQQPPMGPQDPPHPFMQSQPARRFVPENLPSPVTEDDECNEPLIFDMDDDWVDPLPLATRFFTQDEISASRRYIRSTMYNIPSGMETMEEVAVPFGIVVSPLAQTSCAEDLPLIINMGEIGPVRCNRCEAYMCPFMKFIDEGRCFRCCFCKATTKVPQWYFKHLENRHLPVARPELKRAAYEFVATEDDCRNKTFPKPPALIFLIDVSYNSVKSGLLKLLCDEIKEILKLLPKDEGAETSNMRVGFVTYSEEAVLYNFKVRDVIYKNFISCKISLLTYSLC